MALPQESVNMALFCDFENIALGVRDTKFEKFDIKPVLERLLLKGSIVVKKAYCDWDRYKTFKAAMHEASFELIEIPHVRQSGKNSADIRLVVDALDLCYTKSHVDTFVIISGDSDFSPLVSKLRENAKRVIGVGVKNSTSDLLVANCDEFIFYDDLAREQQRAAAKLEARAAGGSAKRNDDDKPRKQDGEARKAEAIAIAVETFDALASERSDSGRIWASVLKSAIKRRKPGFNETYYGFRAFGNLLDEAQARGLLEIGRDDKSGTFVSRPVQTVAGEQAKQTDSSRHADSVKQAESSRQTNAVKQTESPRQRDAAKHTDTPKATDATAPAAKQTGGRKEHGKGRGSRKPAPMQMPLLVEAAADADVPARDEAAPISHIEPREMSGAVPDHTHDADTKPKPSTRAPRSRKTVAKKASATAAGAAGEASAVAEPGAEPSGDAPPAKAARKSTSRTRRPRKTATSES